MGIAMLLAISLICIDTAASALPLPASVAVAPAVVAVQATADPQLTTPPADEIDPVILAPASEPTAEPINDPLAFEGESDEAVVQRFVDYLEQTTSLTGDFTQIAPSGAISTGQLYLRRPGFLRFEYDPPDPLLIVANGGLVYVYDDALETTDSYPLGKTPLKFLLSRKLNFDETTVVGVDRGVNNVAITLASKKDAVEGELTIIVKAPEMTLIRWIVRDLQNGITVVTLDNVVAGERLANRLFRPPDAGGAFLKN